MRGREIYPDLTKEEITAFLERNQYKVIGLRVPVDGEFFLDTTTLPRPERWSSQVCPGTNLVDFTWEARYWAPLHPRLIIEYQGSASDLEDVPF